jgi:hypothetical protein
MKDAWKRIAGPAVVTLVGLALCGPALAKTEIGLRYGRGDLRGSRLFPGSGDLGATPLIGIQAVFDFVPIIDLEVAGEAYDEDFRFEDGRFGDVVAAGTGNFQDTAILATGKLGIPLTLLGPGSIYAGLGLGAHFVDVDVNVDPEAEGGGGLADGIEDAIRDVAGERTEVEWHAVLGVKTGIPVLPLIAFAEVRYQDVLDKGTPDLGSAYLGVNLILGE